VHAGLRDDPALQEFDERRVGLGPRIDKFVRTR